MTVTPSFVSQTAAARLLPRKAVLNADDMRAANSPMLIILMAVTSLMRPLPSTVRVAAIKAGRVSLTVTPEMVSVKGRSAVTPIAAMPLVHRGFAALHLLTPLFMCDTSSITSMPVVAAFGIMGKDTASVPSAAAVVIGLQAISLMVSSNVAFMLSVKAMRLGFTSAALLVAPPTVKALVLLAAGLAKPALPSLPFRTAV